MSLTPPLTLLMTALSSAAVLAARICLIKSLSLIGAGSLTWMKSQELILNIKHLFTFSTASLTIWLALLIMSSTLVVSAMMTPAQSPLLCDKLRC